jgi:hypothetical protein
MVQQAHASRWTEGAAPASVARLVLALSRRGRAGDQCPLLGGKADAQLTCRVCRLLTQLGSGVCIAALEDDRLTRSKSVPATLWRSAAEYSDRHPVTVELMIFVISALTSAKVCKIMNELDRGDPFHHLKAELIFAAQP